MHNYDHNIVTSTHSAEPKLIAVVVPGMIILVIGLTSFTVTIIMCMRKSQKKDEQQALSSVEVVYDEIQYFEKAPGPEYSADRAVA